MKKNLLSILILALLVVNLVMTAILMFTMTGTMNKTSKLVTDIATVLKLELQTDETGEGSDEVAITDRDVYDIKDKMTITLMPGEDGKAHYYIASVSLSMNMKHKDYKALKDQVEAKESIIKSTINEVISSYTYDRAVTGQEEILNTILTKIQTLFNSDFIFNVSFREVTVQ